MPRNSEVPTGSDRLSRLNNLANRLEAELAAADSSAAVASIGRTLVTVLEQIEGLTPQQSKGTPLDELKARRSARGAASTGAAGASRDGKRGARRG